MEKRDKNCILEALLAELRAIKNYNLAAKISNDKEIKKYFVLFEANEQSHLDGLKKLATKYFTADQMKELDLKINEFKPYETTAKMSLKDILNKALNWEEEQYLRYTQCASFVQNADAKRMFYAFADNENLHAQVLKKMLIDISIKSEKQNNCKFCGKSIAHDLGMCSECAKKELLNKIPKKIE